MPTKGIDYRTISLRDALDLAVLVEEEAKERYLELADQMELHHTPDAEGFFRFMADNEDKHRVELLERRHKLFNHQPSGVTREMLFDVEAPDYSEARVFMTAREALETALRSETKAWTFFDKVLPQLVDIGVRGLFEELRAEEVHHQELVRRELAKLPPDDAFCHEDFADEPVGQD